MNLLRPTLLALALALVSPIATAQAPQSGDADALQSQLEAARLDLAEAAQRLARLQRELIESEGGRHSWIWRSQDGDALQEFEFDLNFDFDGDGDGEPGRRMVFAGFPPRLGVLLGDHEAGEGNRVIGVTPGSGAEAAGIRKDDRLISVAGQDVTEDTAGRVRAALSDLKPGASVDVMIQRGEGTELVMPVTVSSALRDIRMIGQRLGSAGERIEREIIRSLEGLEGLPQPPMPPLPPGAPGLAGLGHDTDLVSNHAGLEPYFGTAEGVLVLRIAAGNPLNLLSGDVILAIDGEPIERPVDVGRTLISRQVGDEVTVEVMREGRPTQVYGTIPETTRSAPSAGRLGLHRLPPKPPAPPAPAQAL